MSGEFDADLEELAGLLDPPGASLDWGFLEYELTGEIPADMAAALEMGAAVEQTYEPAPPLTRSRRCVVVVVVH